MPVRALAEAHTATVSRGPDRPWRSLGTGIVVVVSVMFFLGVALVDIPDHPRVYASFWAIILGLVLWLCALAVKDVQHTYDLFRRGREAGRRDRRAPLAPDGPPRDLAG